jgi:hypothetical protein
MMDTFPKLSLLCLTVFLLTSPSTASHTIFCRRCGSTITTTSHHVNIPHPESTDVTLLPVIQPQAELVTFRNPSSISYDIVTFKRATNIVVRGQQQPQQTFYPPFDWEPVYCKKCGAHIGWKFKAPRNEKDNSCPLGITSLPPMKPPDLTGSAHPNVAAAAQKLAEDQSTTSSPPSPPPPPPPPSSSSPSSSIQEMLSTLEGVCLTKQTGYWVYEWCFRQHVRQFHLEPYVEDASTRKTLPEGASIVKIADTKYRKHPDWSLGQYILEAHQTKKGREKYRWSDTRKRGTTKEPKYVSHLHAVNGQKCDETSDGRRTEVRLLCCDFSGDKNRKEDSNSDSNTASTNGDQSNSREGVSIRSIKETSICRYRIEICAPVLCSRDDFRSPNMKPSAPLKKQTPKQTKEEEIIEKLEVYQTSQTQCVFYGLIWPRLLLQDSPSYKWIASVTPIVGIRRER